MTDRPRQDEPGVLLLDDRRVFVAANEAAASLLGTTAEELIGRRADEFMPLVARPLYPLAWQGFLFRKSASGEYAAQLEDGSLAHLAYVGFANRPVRGLHFFVLEPLAGSVDASVLKPAKQESYIQVGAALSDDIQRRLVAEADRQEWRLPVRKDAQRAVVVALFDAANDALDALDELRKFDAVDASIATAAGSTTDTSLTILAGRVPYAVVGRALESIRYRRGRIVTSVDERFL